MAKNDKEIVEQAYCAALTKRVIKNKEIRLDGKLSKKPGLRDNNVGRANWDGERNNHIRHSACLSKIVSYLFNRKYVTIFFITLPATLFTA